MWRFKFYFAWYDGWFGYYYDRKHGDLYLQIIPWFGLRIDLRRKPRSSTEEEPIKCMACRFASYTPDGEPRCAYYEVNLEFVGVSGGKPHWCKVSSVTVEEKL